MRRDRALGIILGTVLLWIPELTAQQVTKVQLSGLVRFESGEAVPGVTVTLAGAGLTASAVTDAEGRYRFLDLAPGEYEIIVSTEGFTATRARVRVGVAQTATFNIVLDELPETITVTAGPPLKPFTIVRVFYGTDRRHVASPTLGSDYTAARGPLTLGTCTVSIPKDHRLGDWELPSILTFGVANQAKHVMLLSVTAQGQRKFIERLRARVERSDAREALVFVHGYNVSFSEAVQRTAILAYDLEFDGAPITFSWPSRGKVSRYLADEQSVEYAVPHLANFLSLVARESGASKIHLVAHSMGNRALLRALASLSDAGRTPGNIGHVVLTAPDVDRDIFAQLVETVRSAAGRTTLYASSNDKAIGLSRRAHDGPRAGEGGTQILVLDGIDSVDVSAVDTSFLGHSYFAENRSIITDLIDLIQEGRPPNTRDCLSARAKGPLRYWVFDRCLPQ